MNRQITLAALDRLACSILSVRTAGHQRGSSRGWPRSCSPVVEAGAADALVIKLIKCGGLRAAEHLAAVAGTVGLPVVVVSPFETHVGAAAGVHLALTLPPSPFAQELSLFTVEPRGPRTASAIQTDGDRILPPTATGLGVTFE